MPRIPQLSGLFVLNLDGPGLKRVTNTPDTEQFVDWGPHMG